MNHSLSNSVMLLLSVMCAAFSLKSNADDCKKINASLGCFQKLRAGNATITGDLKVKGTISGAQKPLVATYNVPGDFPSLSACLDSLRGVIIEDVTINIAPGTYQENIDLTGIVGPEPLTSAVPLSEMISLYQDSLDSSAPDYANLGKGLKIVGDPRLISGIIYSHGYQLMYGVNIPNQANTGWNRKFGSPLGTVAISQTGNTLSVSIVNITSGIFIQGFGIVGGVIPNISENPAFDVEDVIPGDTIGVRDQNNTWNFVTVTAVSGNTITYSGPSLNIGNGVGTAIIICPRVHFVTPPNVEATLLAPGANAAIQGLWLENTIGYGPDSPFAVVESRDNAIINLTSSLCTDLPSGCTSGSCVLTNVGGAIYVFDGALLADFHITVLGGLYSVGCYNEGYLFGGAWPISDTSFIGIQVQYGKGQIDCFEVVNSPGAPAGIDIFVGEMWTLNGYSVFITPPDIHAFCVALDSSSRIVSRAGNVLLDGGGLAAAFGVDGSKVDISWPEYINESFISNCPQAFYGVGMEFFTMFPITFTNVPLIAQCSAGTKLVMSNEVTIVNSNADPIILDDSSSFVAPYSTPFPNDIYTYAGSGVMNSAFNMQVIDSVGSATITMDPSAFYPETASLLQPGIYPYVGKTYQLTSITAGPHTLQLVAPAKFLDGTSSKTFTGIGSTMTFNVISTTQVAITARHG